MILNSNQKMHRIKPVIFTIAYIIPKMAYPNLDSLSCIKGSDHVGTRPNGKEL